MRFSLPGQAALRILERRESVTDWPHLGENSRMAQGKRISVDIGDDAIRAIKDMGAAAKQARLAAGEGQAAAAVRLGVHVQTVGRIEAGEPGVAIGHVIGMLALYGVTTELRRAGPTA
ncbi:helix-turn-helix domain-containing protein [Variovorax sp. OK202]|uniref:helix-turn-helix domain-containing protein n=2 Tax=unclassified Variovorax TaxID=663243 RepID=UPI00210CE7D4|nr:helix-turn-helix domain-containing protein [Variovorax sp. OK202]